MIAFITRKGLRRSAKLRVNRLTSSSISGNGSFSTGAASSQFGENVAIGLPPSLASRASPMYPRFVWSREAPDHGNPGVHRDACLGRQFQFIAKLAFSPKRYEGCETSILARFAGRASGTRRRGARQPGVFERERRANRAAFRPQPVAS